MRVTEQLALVDKIGRELQKRFGFSDIDAFLDRFDVAPPTASSYNSKWVYAKEALKHAPESVIIKIAEELEMIAPGNGGRSLSPPRNWANTRLFRLFISHISKDKLIATRLKSCLAPYGVAGFVAHEDIHPTLEWQGEIERALHTMDGFIAVHTPGFSASFWTQQEVGFAVGRGTKIISFKMGEDPTGFISKQQALARRDRTAEDIAKEIDTLLAEDARTADRLKGAKASIQPAEAIDDDIPF